MKSMISPQGQLEKNQFNSNLPSSLNFRRKASEQRTPFSQSELASSY